MSWAHLHVILNHISIVGVPLMLGVLFFGILTKNNGQKRFGYWAIVVLALLTIPVFLTGEPAEELVERIPGIAEATIEEHEESGELALILTLVTGGAALLGLWFQYDPRKGPFMEKVVLGVGVAAFVALVYTGNLGGKIRHTEFYGAVPVAVDTGTETEDEDDDE